jgi:ribosomal protein S27AE
MPNYVEYKVMDPDKVIEPKLSCVNCGTNNIMDNDRGRVATIDDTHNTLELRVCSVCARCSTLNVFVFRIKYTQSAVKFVLKKVMLEVSDE